MTGIALYAALKFWLPIVTFFGLLIKAYKTAKGGIQQFADSLLGNHLHTIQENTGKTAALLEEVRDDQRTMMTDIAILKDR